MTIPFYKKIIQNLKVFPLIKIPPTQLKQTVDHLNSEHSLESPQPVHTSLSVGHEELQFILLSVVSHRCASRTPPSHRCFSSHRSLRVNGLLRVITIIWHTNCVSN